MSEATRNFWRGFLTPDKIIYAVCLIVAVAVNLNTMSKQLDSIRDKFDAVHEQLGSLQSQVQGFNARTEGVEKSNVKITTQIDFLLAENEARAKEWKLFRELIGNQDTQIAVIRDRVERKER